MKKQNIKFYRSLITAISLPLTTVIGVTALYIIMMSFINHKAFPFDYFVLIFALVKTYLIALVTFKHLSKLVKICLILIDNVIDHYFIFYRLYLFVRV